MKHPVRRWSLPSLLVLAAAACAPPSANWVEPDTIGSGASASSGSSGSSSGGAGGAGASAAINAALDPNASSTSGSSAGGGSALASAANEPGAMTVSEQEAATEPQVGTGTAATGGSTRAARRRGRRHR